MVALRVMLYLLLIAAAIYIVSFSTRLIRKRVHNSQSLQQGIIVRGTEILGEEESRSLSESVVTLVGWSIGGVVVYTLLGIIFSISPATSDIGSAILISLARRASALGNGFIRAIPNIVQIIFIIIAAKLISRIFSYIMVQIERGNLVGGVYLPRELARPVMIIGNSLIFLFALAAVVPIIPGLSNQGQVLLLVVGAIITLASSTTISNVISGFVLAYMRPFRTGDAVKVGPVYGMIVERTLLYTRIRTPRNEDVLFPNQQILSSEITNLSINKAGLIVHTSVTIGYDVPRKKVEELLLEAARKVELGALESEPFVLITELGDFSVTYETNMYTSEATRIPVVLSQLHKNIKDAFEQAGVEILSPNYYSIRDGNKSTIPAQDLGL